MKKGPLFSLWNWLVLAVLIPTGMALAALVFAATAGANMPFDRLDLWWTVFAVPLVGLLALYGAWRRRSDISRFASSTLAPALLVQWSARRGAIRAGLLAIATLLIVAGLVGPRWGRSNEKQEVLGVDVVVALDVSRSMLAEDAVPNRILAAKREIDVQLSQRSAFQRMHRLGLMAFAGDTSLRLPLTTDHFAFRRQLETINIGSAPRGGTAIAQAMERSAELLESSPEKATKLVLVFTDGEDHEGGPVETAKKLYEQHGIRIYTVSVGDADNPAGATIPIEEGGKKRELVHDGTIVFTKPNEEHLRAIAEAGGGTYVRLKDFRFLVDKISSLERTKLATEQQILHKARFQWFLGPAMLLLAWEVVWGERRRQAKDAPRRVWQEVAKGNAA